MAATVSRDDVQAVAEGRAWPIRNMDPEVAPGLISGQIMLVAGLYGVRVKPDVLVLQECIALMYDHYSYMGPAEITNAYRAWAAGKSEGIEMYAGEFTPRQFGSVMAGYAKYRRVINRELAVLEGLDKEAEDKRKRDEQYRHRFAAAVARFEVDLQEAQQARKMTSWQDVPNTWYNYANHLGLVTWPGDQLKLPTGVNKAGEQTFKEVDDAQRKAAKKPYWVAAQRIVRRAHRGDMVGVTSGSIRANLQEAFERLWKGRAIIVSQRMIVFERLLYGPTFMQMAIDQQLYDNFNQVNYWLFPAWVRLGLVVPERELAARYWKMAVAEVYSDLLPGDRQARAKVRSKVKEVYGKLYLWHEVLKPDKK